MKNITYENQGNSTYLVYEIDPADIVDNLSLGMINNNKIIGLAPVIYSQVDNRKYLKYNISAKVSASTFLAGAASRNRILGVFSGVSKALLSAEEYMLDANNIMLDLDYIYVDVTTCEAELICLPVQRGNFNDVVSFFKNIIFSVTYDQTENCDYVAKIIGCLNNHSSFSLQNFMQTIDELNGKRINLQTLQNNQPPEPEPVYTEILHGESQEFKAASENMQKINMQTSPLQNQFGQNMRQGGAAGNPQNFQYNGQMNTPPIQSAGGQMGNNFSQNQPVGNPQNFPQNYLPNNVVNNQVNTMQNQQSMGMRPMPIPQNQKPSKKTKAEKKPKKGQYTPPQNYTVPGAPIKKNPQIPISGAVPQGMPQGKPAKQSKKGGLGGLFHKKGKTDNSQINSIPPIPQNGRGNLGMPPVGTGFGGQPIPPNGMGANGQQIPPNGMGNGAQPIPPNGMGNMRPPMPGNGGNNMQPISPNGMGNGVQPMPSQPPIPQGRSMNFGETTVLDSGMANGETSVLSAPTPSQPYLLRKKNGEKIFITSAFFRIGKEANYVDYFIGDNSAISRSHANIIISGNDYYIIDTNSKNHTYVNGQMIQSNTETLLTHGSAVKLANEEFEFRMY